MFTGIYATVNFFPLVTCNILLFRFYPSRTTSLFCNTYSLILFILEHFSLSIYFHPLRRPPFVPSLFFFQVLRFSFYPSHFIPFSGACLHRDVVTCKSLGALIFAQKKLCNKEFNHRFDFIDNFEVVISKASRVKFQRKFFEEYTEYFLLVRLQISIFSFKKVFLVFSVL